MKENAAALQAAADLANGDFAVREALLSSLLEEASGELVVQQEERRMVEQRLADAQVCAAWYSSGAEGR